MPSSIELISGFNKYGFLHEIIVKQQQKKKTQTNKQVPPPRKKLGQFLYQSEFLN